MKDCAYVKERLFDYVSGKLDDTDAENIKAHITECGSCRKEYEAQKFYFENLPSVSEYLADCPSDIKARVMDKIREEKENPPVYIPKKFHFSYGTAASLVLVAALFILTMKTGIVDQKGFDSAETESLAPRYEVALDEEAAPEYDYGTDENTGVTGTANDGMVYFSATTTDDVCYDVAVAEAAPEEPKMMMAPPHTRAERAVESESVNKALGTQDSMIAPTLTIEELCNIVSEKGNDLTWSDFEGYESFEVGSGIFILHYPINDDFFLAIAGMPDEEPKEIRLVYKGEEGVYITLPDGDIDEFVTENTK